MWNPIKNYRLRRNWRLVSTLQAFISWEDRETKKLTGEKDTIYYYLSENGLGQRKCTHEGTKKLAGDGGWSKEKRMTHPYYLGRIRPWLEGRYDPDIPSYDSIKAKEFKDALAGKIT